MGTSLRPGRRHHPPLEVHDRHCLKLSVGGSGVHSAQGRFIYVLYLDRIEARRPWRLPARHQYDLHIFMRGAWSVWSHTPGTVLFRLPTSLGQQNFAGW
jgi:hypothetical protein